MSESAAKPTAPHSSSRASRMLGDLRLTLVDDGPFGLDGGAMFGVVPRVLWERQKPPDAKNRIAMTTNCLLVEHGDDLLLVDTGLGDKMSSKEQAIYGLKPDARRLPDAIREAGYGLGDITHVLITHMHFDHCGWNTRVDAHGQIVPTFPNARYFLERGEVEHARSPNLRDRASYDPRNWEPLFEAGVAEVFDDEIEPVPGVRAKKVPGHNRDMCIVLLGDHGTKQSGSKSTAGADTRGVFWADLVPTSAHVPYAWVMGYDLYPVQTLENKQLWLPRAAEEGWLCVFEHDPEVPWGRLAEEKPGRYRVEPLAP